LKGNVGVNVYNNNYYDKNNLMATKFFDTNNTNVLTINFMNMARTDNIANVMDLFDSSIKEMADYVNDKLISYIEEEKEKPLYNEVIILDYPSSDIIRKIYESNYNSSSISIDGQSIYTNNNYKLLLSTLSSKWDSKKGYNIACLQSRTIINKQGFQEEVIKTNYKCVDNKLNQWRVIIFKWIKIIYFSC